MDDIGQLIAAEIPTMRRYARARLRDRDRAEDFVQDTILLALEKNHLYERGTNLRAWLITMMHNQYVNAVRRSMRRGEITMEALPLAAPAPQISRLELRDLERAIRHLPEEQRETLLFIGLHGMNYADVAQLRDVPIGTVRSRLSRAREELRRVTEGEEARPSINADAQQKSCVQTVRSWKREGARTRDDDAPALHNAPSPLNVTQVSSAGGRNGDRVASRVRLMSRVCSR